MGRIVSLLDILRSAKTEDDLRRIGFRHSNTVINWPKSLRKKMWGYLESNDENKKKIWWEMSEKFKCETFHPTDELLCVISDNGENLLYPSVVYKTVGNRLRFKRVDILEKSFVPVAIIDHKTEEQVDTCYFMDEKYGEGKELEAVLKLLQ